MCILLQDKIWNSKWEVDAHRREGVQRQRLLVRLQAAQHAQQVHGAARGADLLQQLRQQRRREVVAGRAGLHAHGPERRQSILRQHRNIQNKSINVQLTGL